MTRARRDEGQVLLLIIVYAAVAALLVAVVVDSSRALLHRRALAAAADGAALAAAGAPDAARLAEEGASTTLPLSEASVATAVARYVRSADLARRFDALTWTTTTDGRTATVVLSALVRLPLTTVVGPYGEGVRVTVRASARSPVVGGS